MARRIAGTRQSSEDQNLVEGIPHWMKDSIYEWIDRYTTTTRRSTGVIYTKTASFERVVSIERDLRVSFGGDGIAEKHKLMMRYAKSSDEQGLDVVGAMLITNDNYEQMIQALNIILIQSGSKWVAKKLGAGQYGCLEERVDETTEASYELVAEESSNDSSEFIKKAWHSAFSRTPDPSHAYSDAIKAVEASAWTIITPNNDKATLGTILGEMRGNPHKWSTKISDKTTNQGVLTTISAMQLLWDGQTDRHGTSSPKAPSQEAAEQAVITAVTVCNYFNRSYIT